MTEPRTANLLGALALGIADELKRATERDLGGGAAPAALVTVLNYPGRGIGVYGRALGLTHSGTVRLVDRIEADGLVERRSGADGRSAAVFPTPAGRRRAEEILAARRRALEGALAALSEGERGQLENLAQKLLAGLVRADDGAAPGSARADRVCRLCELAVCPQDVCPVERAAGAGFGGQGEG